MALDLLFLRHMTKPADSLDNSETLQKDPDDRSPRLNNE
jgi:hypothetical protein